MKSAPDNVIDTFTDFSEQFKAMTRAARFREDNSGECDDCSHWFEDEQTPDYFGYDDHEDEEN